MTPDQLRHIRLTHGDDPTVRRLLDYIEWLEGQSARYRGTLPVRLPVSEDDLLGAVGEHLMSGKEGEW